ncbi:VanZ family protein [Pleionea sediminis]|uniref:VanZ family protein n=1 Tax=Pleionea sediminis TaxID=2569479 RepID=UPI0011850957|nr:VanZ family protein [Pleionea sediminis]
MVDYVIHKVLPKLGHPLWKLAAVSALALLLYLTLTPGIDSGIHLPHIDKMFHAIAFAGVTFLMLGAFVNLNRWFIALAMLILGVAIEFIQLSIPGRSFSWVDWIGDAVGVFLVLAIFGKRSEREKPDSHT